MGVLSNSYLRSNADAVVGLGDFSHRATSDEGWKSGESGLGGAGSLERKKFK